MPRVSPKITPLGVQMKVRKGWTVICTYQGHGRTIVQLHTPRKRIKTYTLETP